MRLEDTRNSIKIGDLTELRAARCEGQPALRRRGILSLKGDGDYLPQKRRFRVSQLCDSLTRTRRPAGGAVISILSVASRLHLSFASARITKQVEPTRAPTIEAYTSGRAAFV